jgi:2-amino-4-hydroxy-6-hydroxymethyldihydropteridine diphosphokinase
VPDGQSLRIRQVSANPGSRTPTNARQRLIAYIALGANLDDPERQVRSAIRDLATLPQTDLVASSPLYRTAPVGPPGQPDYINAVARLVTGLSPRDLLEALQAVEIAHGRLRDGTRWGPRALDLDILLYGERRIDEPGLCIPHPEMSRRAFVLVPLADVAPIWLQIPGEGGLAELLMRCPRDGIEPLGSPGSGLG